MQLKPISLRSHWGKCRYALKPRAIESFQASHDITDIIELIKWLWLIPKIPRQPKHLGKKQTIFLLFLQLSPCNKLFATIKPV